MARALNRQRSRKTAVPSREHLDALATVAAKILDACAAASDVKTPMTLAILAETFYVEAKAPAEAPGHLGTSLHELYVAASSTAASDATRLERSSRFYLKDALLAHPIWADAAFWERALADAAVDAVASTCRGDGHYFDVVATAAAPRLAGKVHATVHAQLAAFCLAMREFGNDRATVRAFAAKVCATYQLPRDDLATLLFAYADPDADADDRADNTLLARDTHRDLAQSADRPRNHTRA